MTNFVINQSPPGFTGSDPFAVGGYQAKLSSTNHLVYDVSDGLGNHVYAIVTGSGLVAGNSSGTVNPGGSVTGITWVSTSDPSLTYAATTGFTYTFPQGGVVNDNAALSYAYSQPTTVSVASGAVAIAQIVSLSDVAQHNTIQGKITVTDGSVAVASLSQATNSGDLSVLQSLAPGYSVADNSSATTPSGANWITFLDGSAANLISATILDNGVINISGLGISFLNPSVLAVLHNANGTPYQLAVTDSAANYQSHLDLLENLAANNHIASAQYSSAPGRVTVTVAQVSGHIHALGALHTWTVTDTPQNLVAAADQLESWAQTNTLTVTSDGPLPVTVAQLKQIESADSDFLKVFSDPLGDVAFAISDTAANIGANIDLLANPPILSNGRQVFYPSIAVTDNQFVLVSRTQATSDTSALNKLTTPWAIPVSGTSGNDTIQSQGTHELVDGGAGIDTYVMNFSRSQITIHYSPTDLPGGVSVTAGNSTDYLKSVEWLQLSDARVWVGPAADNVAMRRDLNGDDVSDVLWRNGSTGDTGYWGINNNVATWHDFGVTSTAYSVVGTGDFNGDGISDVLWRNNSNGDTGYWGLSNDVATWHDFGITSTAYSVVGTGDFNGDGTSDVLWRNNSTGDTGYWGISNNGNTAAWHDFGITDPAYSVVGTGDFNGDGTSDVLWRNNSTGDTGYWGINNNVASWHDFGVTSTAYSVAGTGDFNGDGTSDVLWRNNSSGDTGYWGISHDVATWHDFGITDPSYTVAGTGDYNGDGTSDVLWRNNSTGDTGYWGINNNVASWHDFGITSTAYNVQNV